MKISDLIVENSERVSTGNRSVDSIVSQFSDLTPSAERGLPVFVSDSDWQTLQSPERISKTFSFSSIEKQKYFINEIMSYQHSVNHHATIIIKEKSILVEAYTHTVNSVTSQDLKLARFADEIYEDTRYFSK